MNKNEVNSALNLIEKHMTFLTPETSDWLWDDFQDDENGLSETEYVIIRPVSEIAAKINNYVDLIKQFLDIHGIVYEQDGIRTVIKGSELKKLI
jgi:hypothetical protein